MQFSPISRPAAPGGRQAKVTAEINYTNNNNKTRLVLGEFERRRMPAQMNTC